MSYRKIQAALDAHLQSHQSEDVIFAGPARHPDRDRAHLLVRFVPGKSKAVFVGRDNPRQRTGTYHIHIHDRDRAAALVKADALEVHFKPGSELVFEGLELRIIKVEIGREKSDLAQARLPLIVTWRSHF